MNKIGGYLEVGSTDDGEVVIISPQTILDEPGAAYSDLDRLFLYDNDIGMSTEHRTLGVFSRPRPLGPNGEKICYNCGGPLPKGRTYNCSAKCSKEWQCKTSPSCLRAVLKQRDHGICAICRADTAAIKKEYAVLPNTIKWGDPADPRTAFLELHGVPRSRACGDWWDADHITPVIEGGGECGLENLRTLCIPCHAQVTSELAARRAQGRRAEKTRQRDDDRGLLAGL